MIQNTIEITDLTHDGRGVGRVRGKTCFIEGALPGESVSWVLKKSHRQYDEGSIETIVSASPHRVEPKCQYFGSCGGCQIQHLSYAAQITAKQNRLNQALQHKHIAVKNWLGPITSNPWRYRRRARLAVIHPSKQKPSSNQSELAVGFKRRASNAVLRIESCPILVQELDQLLPHLPDLLDQLSNLQRESVAEIELSNRNSKLSICLLAAKNCPMTPLLNPPAVFARCDIWIKPKGSDGVLIYSNSEKQKTPHQKLTVLPGFMQANAEVNASMIEKIDQILQLTDQDVLLDLFCGSGNFSFPQALLAKEVIGIEADPLAVEQANSVSPVQTNISFRCVDLFDTEALEALRPLFRKASAVLLDPPRAGAEAVVAELVKSKPKQILYVSCHPATFVRDAEKLISKGYSLDSIGLLDMFPQSMHSEVVAHFLI